MNMYCIMYWFYLQHQAFLVSKDAFYHWKYMKYLLRINGTSFCQIVIDRTFIIWNIYYAGYSCSLDMPGISLSFSGRHNCKIIGFGISSSSKLYFRAYAVMAKLCYSCISRKQKFSWNTLPNYRPDCKKFLDVFFCYGEEYICWQS